MLFAEPNPLLGILKTNRHDIFPYCILPSPFSLTIIVMRALFKKDVSELAEFFLSQYSNVYCSIYKRVIRRIIKQSEQDTCLLKSFIYLCVRYINARVQTTGICRSHFIIIPFTFNYAFCGLQQNNYHNPGNGLLGSYTKTCYYLSLFTEAS